MLEGKALQVVSQNCCPRLSARREILHMAVRTAESSQEEILPSLGCPRALEGMENFRRQDGMTRVGKNLLTPRRGKILPVDNE